MFKKRNVKGSQQKKAALRVVEDDVEYLATPPVVPAKKRKIREPDDTSRSAVRESGLGEEHVSAGKQQAVALATVDAPDRRAESSGARTAVGAHVRTRVVVDYQPDVCKDYRQTGFCGYGDSCKFLHSRDDFRAGWRLNEEWKVGQTEAHDLEEIPFRCVLCRGHYQAPVRTRCGHYFCGRCFARRVRETRQCAVCGADTQGVAQSAARLRELLAAGAGAEAAEEPRTAEDERAAEKEPAPKAEPGAPKKDLPPDEPDEAEERSTESG
ncbi:AaceriAFR499Cp [[Ashbya] aceris (nom. inval.)]|nr:AaceriAFR499Cp [[Ashbya] aceris (nom. inval.)]